MKSLELAPFGVETLDDPAADPAVVRTSLRNIARANRWFGGRWALYYGLHRLLAEAPPARLTLLDIGTGLGDLPRAAVRWGARRGLVIRPIGLERSRPAATLAAAGGLSTVLGCAGALPVRENGVDLVLVSQVAHHLAPAAVVELMRACDRLARHGVLIADLRRSPLAAVGFWLGARALGFDAATRADGITSVRRGFTPLELTRLAARAGVPAEVTARPGFRLVMTWRTDRSHAHR